MIRALAAAAATLDGMYAAATDTMAKARREALYAECQAVRNHIQQVIERATRQPTPADAFLNNLRNGLAAGELKCQAARQLLELLEGGATASAAEVAELVRRVIG